MQYKTIRNVFPQENVKHLNSHVFLHIRNSFNYLFYFNGFFFLKKQPDKNVTLNSSVGVGWGYIIKQIFDILSLNIKFIHSRSDNIHLSFASMNITPLK